MFLPAASTSRFASLLISFGAALRRTYSAASRPRANSLRFAIAGPAGTSLFLSLFALPVDWVEAFNPDQALRVLQPVPVPAGSHD